MLRQLHLTLMGDYGAVLEEKLEDSRIALDLDIDDFVFAVLKVLDVAVEVAHLPEDYLAV